MRILWKQLGAFALTVVLIAVANIAVAGGSSAATA